jgi:hypothetical protein
MFLLAGQLHPHGQTHRTGQQHRVSAHIVGAVAAVATGRFHADDLDVLFGIFQQPRQIRPQHVWVLRAGPDANALRRVVRQPAGRSDGAVNLVGPQIGARHTLTGLGQRLVDIAQIQHDPLDARVVANRLLDIAHVRQLVLPGLPTDIQLFGCLRRLFFPHRHYADEIADHHHFDDAGYMRDG